MSVKHLLSALLLLASLPAAGFSQDFEDLVNPARNPDYVPENLRPITAQLHPQHGKITLGDGLAEIDLPDGIGYLPPEQTDLYMLKIIRFPGKIKSLGTIISTEHPIGSPASWYTLISYNDDGHVDDSKGTALDQAALLRQLQEDNKEHNDKLIKKGLRYLAVAFNGWAEKPSFNPAAHTLSWAIEVHASSELDPRLIYNLRALGRHGLLSFTIDSRMEQQPMLEANVAKLLSAIHFLAPNRYGDFTAGTDKNAPYDLNYLITEHRVNASAAEGNPASGPIFALVIKMLGILVVLVAAGLWYKQRKR